jgi:hypothetical protein
MDCVFKKHKDKFKCVNCGVIKPMETHRNCTPQAPSIIKKGVNFIKSTVNHIANKMKKVSQKETDRRIDICKGCEFFTDGEHPSCSKCGCYMNIKARWESEHCPIDKW